MTNERVRKATFRRAVQFRRMTRILLIFLLTMLPLQMTWAVAAVYCVHESSASVTHVGHHEHEHETSSDDESTPTSLLAADADCGVCQLGHVGVLHAPPDLMPLSAFAPDYARSNTDLLSSVRPERPERPKWAPAV
jgi:hypothetical protein